MNKMSNVLWGFVLVVLGIIFGLNALDITNINLFFDGWWTFFIIVPAFISLFNSNESKTSHIIWLIIGIALLLACNNVINFTILWKLLVPFVLVAIGLSLIFKDAFNLKVKNRIKELNKNSKETKEYYATFASQKLNFSNERYTGCSLNAVCGGIECDLCDSEIKEDVVIECNAIFGGITIIVPENVNVKVNSMPIFGGVSNKSKNAKDNKYTVYVNATCMFGGVDIK